MSLPFCFTLQGWRGRGLALILGAIAVLGHAPFHFWPLTLISLAWLYGRLIWAARQTRTGRAGFGSSFWWALGYFAAGTFWIGSAFIERGPAFIPLMPFMVGGLACLLALFWGLAGLYLARIKITGLVRIFAFTAAFTLAELIRGHIFGGLPWNLPAYIFEAGSRPSQIARWINAYGLSAIVLLISAALGQAVLSKQRIFPVALALVPILALFLIGHVRLSKAQLETYSDIQLRLVSVPFKQSEKLDDESSVRIVNDFIRSSVAPGAETVTHLVWPEGAVNGLALDNPGLLQAVGQSLASIDDTPPIWLMNSLITERDAGRQRFFNVSAAVSFDGRGSPRLEGVNRKRKLVPFGEHIPFMDWMEDIQMPLISTNLASISPAKSKQLGNFPDLPRVSPQICYEIIFPGFTPIDQQNPPAFILNQSNDAWFGKKVGPSQHANIARYRSIESGLPIVRAASNGVSAVIDPYGRIFNKIDSPRAFYIDTTLVKGLKFNTKTKIMTLMLLLLSLIFCVILVFIRAPQYEIVSDGNTDA